MNDYIEECTEVTEEMWEKLLERVRQSPNASRFASMVISNSFPNHWISERFWEGEPFLVEEEE